MLAPVRVRRHDLGYDGPLQQARDMGRGLISSSNSAPTCAMKGAMPARRDDVIRPVAKGIAAKATAARGKLAR